MLRQAYERLPPVRAWLDTLDAVHHRAGEAPPSRLIFPPATQENAEHDARALFDIGHSGQLGTVANLALYEVISELGIRPDAVLGHSNGEHAAVMAACMNIGSERERICEWLRRSSLDGIHLGPPQIPERMAAVSSTHRATLDAVLESFAGEVFLAMDNCPLQQVLGGHLSAIRAASAQITAAGGICGELPFERAYHTPLFAGWANMLATRYRDLPLTAPRVPVYSCLTGAAMPAEREAMRAIMVEQWTAPVRLRAAVEALYDFGVRHFIEVGPDSKLSAFVSDTLRGRPHLAVSIASAQRGDLAQLHILLASLHSQGVAIDPARLRHLLGVAPAPTPETMPPVRNTAATAQAELIADTRASLERMERLFHAVRNPIMPLRPPHGALLRDLRPHQAQSTHRLSLKTDPYLADHSLGRPPGRALAVLSFTTSLALAAEAARQFSGAEGAIVLTDLRSTDWLALDGGTLNLHVETKSHGNTVQVALSNAASQANPAFTAKAQFVLVPPIVAPEKPHGSPPQRWTPDSFYRNYAFHGPSFQGLQQITTISPSGIAAELNVTRLQGIEAEALEADPALLDCAGQLVAFWLLEHVGLVPNMGIFPYAIRRVVLYPPPEPGTRVHCHGHIVLHDGIRTEASFLFTANGRTIALIEGLEQRLLEFPATLANWIFGACDGQFSSPSADGGHYLDFAEWSEALGGDGGIWARALAHRMLDEAALAEWLPESKVALLLETIVARESADKFVTQNLIRGSAF